MATAGGAAPMCMSREFRLFCLALRRPLHPTDSAALRDGLAAGPDWDCILAGARRHRVAPLLLAGLHAVRSPDLPAESVAELRREAVAAARRSLAQTAEIARLVRIFSEAGIPVLALKGIVLSAQLYGDPALRDPRDIDLLVDPQQFDAAGALLIEAGYRRNAPILSPRQSAAYQRWIKEAEYVHPVTGIWVELHHRLSDNPALIPCKFTELWPEREEVEIASIVVATLPRRHLPVYLCVHGAHHCWERLRWLVDLAAALQEPGAMEAAIAAAEAEGLGPPMLHALVLAHDWLGLPVDEPCLARARVDRRVAHLHRILTHFYAGPAWYQTPRRGSFAGFLRYSLWLRLYNYSLKRDWRYRRHQALRELITPADWEVVRLPDRLFWLFPLLRPIGWLVRRWRG
jgi:hypothetical protein